MPESPEIEALLSDPGLTLEKLVKSMFPAEWNAAHRDIDEYYPRGTVSTPQENLYRQAEADEKWCGSHDRPGNIACPTLIIWGTEDLDSPVQNGLLLAGLIPWSWLVRVKGAGHGLMYQAPEQFADIVACFLENGSIKVAMPLPGHDKV